MKKGTKKAGTHLIVDEFEKIKKSAIPPNQKASHSSQHPSRNMRVEDVACKYCGEDIPEPSLVHVAIVRRSTRKYAVASCKKTIITICSTKGHSTSRDTSRRSKSHPSGRKGFIAMMITTPNRTPPTTITSINPKDQCQL